jgi:DNA repair protein RecO (recombination protein O)
MPARVSESVVLRTYPFREADLIVSFFTRDQGKLRGVARRARRPKNNFGSGLERLSHVRIAYFQRENRELVNLDRCELIRSQFNLASDYQAGVALDYLAEVCEQLLPPSEPGERFFRLLLAVLDHLHTGEPGSVWRAVTYFSVWAVQLSGFLPPLQACAQCGARLNDPASPRGAWFARGRPALYCGDCRRILGLLNTWELNTESRTIADLMLRTPVAEIPKEGWNKELAAGLRRFLVQRMEEHIERKLVTAPILEAA